MNTDSESTLVVHALHRLQARNLLMITGELAGGAVRIGDPVVIDDSAGPRRASVRAIDLHTPPGLTTIGIDVDFDDAVKIGDTIRLP
jgi:hypothetical protein